MNQEFIKAVKTVVGLKNVAGGLLFPWTEEFTAAAQTVKLKEVTGLNWKHGYFGEGSAMFYVDGMTQNDASHHANAFNNAAANKLFNVVGPFDKFIGKGEVYQVRLRSGDYLKHSAQFDALATKLEQGLAAKPA